MKSEDMKSQTESLDLKNHLGFNQQEVFQYIDNCLLLSNEIERMIEQQEKIESLQKALKAETLKLETQMKNIQILSKFKILKCQKFLKDHRENLNQISDIYANELEQNASFFGGCLDLYDSFHNMEKDSISNLNKAKGTEHDDDDQTNRPNLSFKDDFSDSDPEEESSDFLREDTEQCDQLFTITNEKSHKLFSKVKKVEKNFTQNHDAIDPQIEENLPKNTIINTNDSPNLKKNRITTKEGLFKDPNQQTEDRCLYEHPQLINQ